MSRKGLEAYGLGIYTGLLGMGNEGDKNLGREKALGGEGCSVGHSRAGVGPLTIAPFPLVLVRVLERKRTDK